MKPAGRAAPRSAPAAPVRTGPVPPLASAALAAAMFGLYLLLAPPVSGDKDASEFTLVLASGGVVHPTGYPLWTLLGHGFVRALHALGAGYPFAANAWAALGGGVATYLFHRLALRVLAPRAALSPRVRFTYAALPVLLFGLNPVWMVECTVVEVHSWQLAWGFSLALAFVGLVERYDSPGADDPRFGWRMAGWGLLCGIGGAHHATSVFLAGATTVALVVALVRARRFHVWVPAVWLAAGVVPIASYAWIAWRAAHPAGAQVWPTIEPTLRSVLDHVTARAYRVYLGKWAPDPSQSAWIAWFVHPFLWAGLASFAAFLLRSRDPSRRRIAAALLGTSAAQVWFAFRYGASDPAAYFLPPLAVACLGLAAVAGPLLERRSRMRPAALAIGALVVAVLAAASLPTLAGRRLALVEYDRSLHAMWSAIPYERGIVVWPDDQYCRLVEFQRFGGEKPELEVLNTASLFNPGPRARFQRRHGFDPLLAVTEANRRQPVNSRFVIGRQRTAEEAHAYALVHETLGLRTGLPVVAFDPPQPLRAWLPVPDSMRTP